MVGRRIAREWFVDRYLLAAGLIVVSILDYAAVGDQGLGRLSVVVVQGVTLLVILAASDVSPRMFSVARFLVVATVIATSLTVAHDGGSIGPSIAGALLAVFAPVAIVQRLKTHMRINIATVAASLCIYLLAGLFFANLYRVMDTVSGPFFAQRGGGGAVDMVYFSFTSLTTLGYGDLTARADLGRMIAVSEALLGQLYLVSVVALLVGNIGRTRTPDPSGPERTSQ